MISRLRSVAIVMASAGVAHAAPGGDDKAVQILIGSVPASAWTRPAVIPVASAVPARSTASLASFLPLLPSSYFAASPNSSRLLFLSPLSPLRAALRVAAQDLSTQAQAVIGAAPIAPAATLREGEREDDATTGDTSTSASARRREVVLRQRRRSVLNERENGAARSAVADAPDAGFETAGLNGHLELLALPSGSSVGPTSDSVLPGGAGLVHLSGYITDDLRVALTGLAAESAATTWRAGAEFEFTAGERHAIEAGAVYGTRFNAAATPFGADIDRRGVGAFRVVHAMKLTDTVSTRAGGRLIDAPFLRHSRSVDPEFSILVEEAATPSAHGRAYVRLDVAGDTLFPGLEVATGESDGLSLSEGLPLLARDFMAQRTWSRSAGAGYRGRSTRIEGKVVDQTVSHALLLIPSALAGAPFAASGSRNRVQTAGVMVERTLADGQAQIGLEYGFGRFAVTKGAPERPRDFHQITTRFDAYLRRTGTGIAFFHRVHDGAPVVNRGGDGVMRVRAQRYLVELRQDVPFVPSLIGADMAVLVSLRNVYYDDVERRSLDEFAVKTPPRRITGGIRVKF